eukprot:g366.t1
MAAADPGTAAKEAYDVKVRWFKEFLLNNRKIELRIANGDHREPVKYLPAYEEGLLSFLSETAPKVVKSLKQTLRLDLQGAFGRNHVTPRGMTAESTGQLMCVEGLVTRCLVTEPKLLYSMHDVDDNYVEQRDHRDTTSLVANVMNSGGMPKQDAEGNDLKMDVAFSMYKEQLSIRVICDGDLCDKAKPGDRVQVIGIYRSFPPPLQDFTDGVFPAKLVATSIKPVKELIEPNFTPEDITNIQKIAEREDTFKLLARSFAPSICGHERVKAGLLLQMLGGVEKNLSNGTHLRGDINVLLVGDPSCGKSQMLRFVMNTAPLAISTTGRGSSGDQGSREFHLEAGAMVLADRGTICIDEFDKMNQADRVAIHEAMEQQCAGMHVTLNARCSVLAAANPIYGNFDPSLDLVKNIGLPDSLLSRFDLIFVVRDQTTEEIDRKIADQVLRQCAMRYGDSRKRGVEQIHSSILERRNNERIADEPAQLFEDLQDQMPVDGKAAEQIVTVDFLHKYIRFAKRRTPVLNDEASKAVTEKYVEMRMRFQSGFADLSAADKGERKPRLAVTTRTLEALIRLATAHAKLKLRKDFVLAEDVEQAYRLMLAAREEDVPEPTVEATAPVDDGADDDGAGSTQRKGRGKKRQRDEEAASSEAIVKGRYDSLKTLVARCFAKQRVSSIGRLELLEMVNNDLAPGEARFEEPELDAGLAKMEAANKIMIDDTGDEVIFGHALKAAPNVPSRDALFVPAGWDSRERVDKTASERSSDFPVTWHGNIFSHHGFSWSPIEFMDIVVTCCSYLDAASCPPVLCQFKALEGGLDRAYESVVLSLEPPPPPPPPTVVCDDMQEFLKRSEKVLQRMGAVSARSDKAKATLVWSPQNLKLGQIEARES